MTTRQTPLKLLRLGTLAGLGITLIQVALFSLKWRISTDQPIMFYLGFLMDRFGAVPYRDVFEMNPPGTPLAYWLIGRLTGNNELLIRFMDLSLLVLLFRVTMAWMRPFGRAAAALGMLFFCFIYFSGGPAMSLEREFLLLLPISLGILLATEGEGLSPALRAAAAGCCFGVAALLKPHAAIGLIPVLIYLGGRRQIRNQQSAICNSRLQIADCRLRMIIAAGLGFALPVGLTALWLWRAGALAPFLEIAHRYWPLYRELAPGMKVLPPEKRLAFYLEFLRGMDGRSPWLIVSFIGAYAGLLHTEPGTERRRRLNLLLQMAGCYLLYLILGGKFWNYHYLPLFFFTSLIGGLCFMELPAAAAPRHGWFLTVAVWLGLYLSLNLPPEYFLQVQGYPPPAPKQGRPDMIANYLKERLNPGDRVQPLDVTGGAVHGMLIAGARLATPFLYDFHFYHHIYNDTTRVLRQRFMDAMTAARPRFVIQVESDKPWVSGEETTTTFSELSGLLRRDYQADFQGLGYQILKRKDRPAGNDEITSRIIVTMPPRPKTKPRRPKTLFPEITD